MNRGEKLWFVFFIYAMVGMFLTINAYAEIVFAFLSVVCGIAFIISDPQRKMILVDEKGVNITPKDEKKK